MFSVSGIKLLFIVAGIIFCVWFGISINNDTKRQKTAGELRRKIRSQSKKLYQEKSKNRN